MIEPAERVVEERVVAEPPPGPPPAERALWPWLLLLLVLVLAGLAAAYFLQRGDEGADRATVPSVIRLPQDDAVRLLEARGFRAAVARQPNPAPRGIVFRQRPGAGRSLPEGATVTVLVSRGPATTDVPNVVGLPVRRATARLEAAGLGAREHRVFSDEPVGVVVAQDPAAGEKAERGSRVRINVSKGTGRVAVPNLVGQDEAEATAALRSAGLKAKRFQVPSAEPAGTVVAQSPQPRTEVAKGDSVRINVSTGEGAAGGTQTTEQQPRTLAVPDVVGRPLAEAQDVLQDRGFVVRVDFVPSQEPEGTVVAQNPPAGTTARRGANVRVNVSEGPQPGPRTAVPDVVGLTEDEARGDLERAGFRVQVFTEPTPDPAEEGFVVRQEPEAGRRAPRGSQVTIYVGEPFS